MEKEIFSQNLISDGLYFFNSKKVLIIYIMILATLAIGGYVGYKYWQKGTPSYSINQLGVAFQNKDTTSVQRYIDIDSVFNNYWPRSKAKYNQFYNNNRIIMAVFEKAENETRDTFKNIFYENIRGKEEGLLLGIMKHLFATKKPIFVMNGDTAILRIDYRHKSYNKNYGLDIIFSRQVDRTWKITDLQGLEDITATVLDKDSRDKTRVSDLSTFRIGIELYFDDNGEYPNSLNLLSPRYLTRIPVDPLDDMSYEYAYSVSNGKILYYHLGTSLEDPMNTVLKNDRDCDSSINPPVNCSSTSTYIHGFNGGDILGCNGETSRFCYDLTYGI